MSDSQIIERLARIVAALAVRRDHGNAQRPLDEEFAAWDSLHQIRVLVAIEKEFGIKFSPTEIERPRSMDHLKDMVCAKLVSRS